MVSNTIKGRKDRKQTVEQKGIRGDLKEQESWLLTVEVEKAGCLLLSRLSPPSSLKQAPRRQDFQHLPGHSIQG